MDLLSKRKVEQQMNCDRAHFDALKVKFKHAVNPEEI